MTLWLFDRAALTDQWRDRVHRLGQGLEASGCARPEAGTWTRASMGRSLLPHSVCPQRTGVSSPSMWPPQQLYSWLVRGFVIYYMKLKETTQRAAIVGTDHTGCTRSRVSRSWPLPGQEGMEEAFLP